MIVVISFTDPYTRAQVRTGLASIIIPSSSTVTVKTQAAVLDIDAVTDSELDLISDVTINEFTTVAELSTFLASLPPGIDSRLKDIIYL